MNSAEATYVPGRFPGREHLFRFQAGSLSVSNIARSILTERPASSYCFISDFNTALTMAEPLAKELVGLGSKVVSLKVEAGEGSKSLVQVERLVSEMLAHSLDKSVCVVAVGGGVVGDLSGFVAGCYMRGVDLIHVPTTLMAQVDSSVGGKTGVNVGAGKNFCGMIKHPLQVLANIDYLSTLPDREFQSGLAEVVKYGVIMDSELFALLEDNISRVLSRDAGILQEIVIRCVQAKVSVVENDQYDTGARRILNYGHTIGHAIEEASDYGVPHGVCVACGMRAIAEMAVSLRMLSGEDAQRQNSLLDAFGLYVPDEVRSLKVCRVEELLANDKKREKDRLVFVMPRAIGQVDIMNDIPGGLVRDVVEKLLGHAG